MDPDLQQTVQQIWDRERDRELQLVEDACVPFLDPPRFLEVGCGRLGLLAGGNRLREIDYQSIGIDIDLEALAANRSVYQRLGADCYELPFRSCSFDVIACRWVLEHLEDPDSAVRELSRVLRFKGCLLLTTPNVLNYAMVVSKYTPTRIHNLVRGWSGSTHNTDTYYRANTRRQLARLAESNGLIIRHLEEVPYSYMYFRFNRHLFSLMRKLSRAVSSFTPRFHLRLVCLMEKIR